MGRTGITHEDHEYKCGRNSLNQETILKIKDDQREYDGVVIGIEQGDHIKEGVARTINELGRSVTSKKKEDREPNGKAKGFIVQYEDQGTFSVGLKGFDDEDKREIWENPEKYIGRHFTYKGMPPVKKFPRSVYFQHWRDEK